MIDYVAAQPSLVVGLLLVAVNTVGLLAMSLFIYIARRAITDLRTLERDLSEFKLTVAVGYVRQEAYLRDIAEMKSLLHEIYNKLDRKADK